jgi:cytochrome c
MAFDAQGNLFVSFGDNTNPFATSYSPIDDTEGRELWDARRSSANSQDLRGKIVRITPQSDGSYTIPAGNLFADSTIGRPEIYSMGHRNPYRISVDHETGYVYWGEVGPDARIDSVYGPKGYDEFNQAREAGNFGWPLFIADNKPYRARDFASGSVADLFDPAAPVNESRFNTGTRVLPPAQPAFIYYPYDRSDEFPRLGEGGRTAMAGPVYRAGTFGNSAAKLPEYYDGKWIHYEWMRGWMMVTTMDQNGDYVTMEPFLDHLHFDHPMDVELGPDGSLYVLEYGTLWFAPNPGARLSRIVYHPDNRPPRARIAATPADGRAPLLVELSAEGSTDADAEDALTYRWEFPDGATAEGVAAQHTFESAGSKLVRLIATDAAGAADTVTTSLLVGNAPPEVVFEVDGNRSFFWESAPVNYHVTVRDAEDGSLGAGISAEQVRVTLDYQPTSMLEAAVVGHQTEQTPAGLAYIQQGDCTGCHGIDQASAGPSYRSVAQRYAATPGAEQQLVAKVIQGGSGVWGEQVMPAHPEMSPDVAGEMVRYILSLATPGRALPLDGTLTLDRHQAGESGAYVLTAAYVDRASDGVAPTEQREQLVLRSAEVRAIDIAESWGMGIPRDSAALEGRGSSAAIEMDGAYLQPGAIDLTGVARVVVTLTDVRHDLAVELRAGGPDGELLGTGALRVSDDGATAEVGAPVTAAGERDLFIVFRSAAGGLSPWSPLARVRTVRFERAEAP